VFFFLLQNYRTGRMNRSCEVEVCWGEVGTSGSGEEEGKWCGTIPGMGGIKENDGGGEFNYDIFNIL
jgi:hypothetical protein